jgi:hypothetical protein
MGTNHRRREVNQWNGHQFTTIIIDNSGTTCKWQQMKAVVCRWWFVLSERGSKPTVDHCLFLQCQLNSCMLYPGLDRMIEEARGDAGHGLSEADFLTQRRVNSEREAWGFTAHPDTHLRDSRPRQQCGCHARCGEARPGHF